MDGHIQRKNSTDCTDNVGSEFSIDPYDLFQKAVTARKRITVKIIIALILNFTRPHAITYNNTQLGKPERKITLCSIDFVTKWAEIDVSQLLHANCEYRTLSLCMEISYFEPLITC